MHSERYKKPETAINGIYQYLSKEKVWRHKSSQFYDSNREFNRIILGFFRHSDIDTKGIMRSKKMIAESPAARIITKRWPGFIEYVKTL